MSGSLQKAHFFAALSFIGAVLAVVALASAVGRNSAGWARSVLARVVLPIPVVFCLVIVFQGTILLGSAFEIPVIIAMTLFFLGHRLFSLPRSSPSSAETSDAVSPGVVGKQSGIKPQSWFLLAVIFTIMFGHSFGAIGQKYIFWAGFFDTESQLIALKSALFNFNNDTGKFPVFHPTGEYTPEAVASASSLIMGPGHDVNILVNPDAGGAIMASRPLGLDKEVFRKRWKGPYMDGDPAEFMVDRFGNSIRYFLFNNALYLQSAGPDRATDPASVILDLGGPAKLGGKYLGDDVLILVSKIRP